MLKISDIKKSIHNRQDVIYQLSTFTGSGEIVTFPFDAISPERQLTKKKMIRTFLNFLQLNMNL